MSDKIKRYVEERVQKEKGLIERDQRESAITRNREIGGPNAYRPPKEFVERHTVTPKTPEQVHQQARDTTAKKLRQERQNERSARALEREAAASHSDKSQSKQKPSGRSSLFRSKMQNDRQKSRDRER